MTYASLISRPGVLVTFCSVFAVLLTIGYLDVTVCLDLASLNQSVTTISLIFLIQPIVHFASLLIASRIMSRNESLAPLLLLFSVCVSTTGAVLSGPMYGLPLENSVTLIAVRQALVGPASGVMSQSAMIALRIESLASGLPDCLSLHSLLSSSFTAVNSLA